MTAREARRTLNAADKQIKQNVADFYADRIDYETFSLRQKLAHSLITVAGQGDAWRRRWRAEAYGSKRVAGVVVV